MSQDKQPEGVSLWQVRYMLHKHAIVIEDERGDTVKLPLEEIPELVDSLLNMYELAKKVTT